MHWNVTELRRDCKDGYRRVKNRMKREMLNLRVENVGDFMKFMQMNLLECAEVLMSEIS